AVTQGITAAVQQLQSLNMAQQGTVQTANQAAAATNQMAQAQAGAAAPAGNLAAAFERLQRNLDANYRATQQFNQAQQILQQAQMAGLAPAARINELGTLNARQLQNQVNAQHAFGNQTRLTRFELINLGRQLQDIGVSLQGGQAFFTVM